MAAVHLQTKVRFSLVHILWLLISAFTLICVVFGTKRLEDIHHQVANVNINLDKDTSVPSSRRLQLHSNTACEWEVPYDAMPTFAEFDKYFDKLSFDTNASIEYIGNLSQYHCKPFEQGYIFTFDTRKRSSLKIAIATILILPTNKSTKQHNSSKGIDVFADVRTYLFRLTNALNYARLNGYSLIIQTKPIFVYQSEQNNAAYNEWMAGATFQKPFLINKFLLAFDWLLFVDWDTLFQNCQNRVEDVIEFAQYKHPQKAKNISIIFGAEKFATLNAGVWIIRRNEWSRKFISDWMFIEENAETFQILKADDVHRDQPLFVALLQGFDVRQDIVKDETYKDLQYHNLIANKKYLTKKLKLNFEQMREQPIWDKNQSQFAVAVDEAIINGKSTHFKMAQADELGVDIQYILIVHFYWNLKYRTKTVFKMFEYSINQCIV